MFLYIKRCLIYLLLPFSITLAADDGTLFNQVHIDAQVERNVENDQLEVSKLKSRGINHRILLRKLMKPCNGD
jgi:hypothetical protein